VQGTLGVIEWLKGIASGKYPNPAQLPNPAASMKSTDRDKDGAIPSALQDGTCPKCMATCVVKIHGRSHCNSCGIDFGPLPEVARVKRSDVLAGHYPGAKR
jgi:hypothetical protein